MVGSRIGRQGVGPAWGVQVRAEAFDVGAANLEQVMAVPVAPDGEPARARCVRLTGQPPAPPPGTVSASRSGSLNTRSLAAGQRLCPRWSPGASRPAETAGWAGSDPSDDDNPPLTARAVTPGHRRPDRAAALLVVRSAPLAAESGGKWPSDRRSRARR